MSVDAALNESVRAAVVTALREFHGVQREAYSVAETAVAIGRSKQFVYDLIESGELPARKVGPSQILMVSVAALRSWLMDGAA